MSSMIFGFTPILAKITYFAGNNSINLVFFRAFLALPILFGILAMKKTSIRPRKREVLPLFLNGLATAATALLLYEAYTYIGVGIATVVHFSYPLFVVIVLRIFFGERMGTSRLTALLLGFLGIVLLTDIGGGISLAGFLFALLSALAFCAKVIVLDKSVLCGTPTIKVTLYSCLTEAVVALLVGIPAGAITFRQSAEGWLFTAAIAVLLSVVGLPCFKFGVERVGGATAAILSVLEPITSVVLGALLFQERLDAVKVAGMLLIIAAIIIISLNEA